MTLRVLWGAMLAPYLAFAACETFPASLSPVRVERTPARIVVKDAQGRFVWGVSPEPAGPYLKDVAVSGTVDRLVIDARSAFAAGAVKITICTPDILRADFAGRDLALRARLDGPRDARMRLYFEGHTKARKHWYASRDVSLKAHPKDYAMVKGPVAPDIANLHLRYDILNPGKGVIVLHPTRYGLEAEMAVPRAAPVVPELIFHAPFDGTAEAAVARGAATPVKARGLSFAPGKKGQAVCLTSAAKSALEYALSGNVIPERGTVALWLKREWKPGRQPWRSLFAFPQPRNLQGFDRIGSGALWLWWLGDTLRADQSDDDDSYVTYPGLPTDDAWLHVAFSWDERGTRLYVNGKRRGGVSDGYSPMAAALATFDPLTFQRLPFATFCVGNRSGGEICDGWIDDLRIYSAPLAEDEVRALYRADAGADLQPPPDYADFARGSNPHVKPAGEKPDLELVATWRAGDARGAETFRAVGTTALKTLDGTPYLEAGPHAGDRYALRFTLEGEAPLWCFEMDYPDDAKRTADLIVQTCRPIGNDYAMQVGYACGAEYPNTGRILTHRCLYWRAAPEVALVAMTARDKAPAALAAVRVYRVRDARLPAAAVREPPANGGWRRAFVSYNEDCAIGYDFGTARSRGHDRDELRTMIDRCAAYMKYVGQDTLAYPGCWYQGHIGEDYNPRNHAPDFLSAWYHGFDREGLSLIPTLNWHNITPPAGLRIDRAALKDGSLHPSCVNILADGKPNVKWHGTPPNYNVFHPDTRAAILKEVDALLDQGAPHSSFKGLCFHLTTHSILWWGSFEGGYNDYAVDAFARANGLQIPVDRAEPLRGRAYADWIGRNARDAWIRWRCDVVTALYEEVARRLRTRRPDLKLWLNSFATSILEHPRVLADDFVACVNRESGLDAAALTARIPNLILCQSVIPADYRWRGERLETPALRARQLELPTAASTFDLLSGAAWPWMGQHDRYWESAIGRGGAANARHTLSCDWLKECPWRVTTVNPSGRHALRHFAEPLRHRDVLGMTKGGFLIGTYGMEDVLVPFVRAFRALPAVVFDDLPSADPLVTIRAKTFRGRRYLYAVNTSGEPRRATLPAEGPFEDLVTAACVPSAAALDLAPYELRSFVEKR